MQYLKQICLIMFFSFLGEVCRSLIPFPIPASIYGMVLLFAALSLKLIRLEQLRESGSFLTSILSVLFVAPTVGLMDHWQLLRDSLLPLVCIVVASVIITFGVAGRTTQWLLNRKKEDADRD